MNFPRLILILLIVSIATGHAALTKVTQEPFIGPGSLTSAAPGKNLSSVSGGTFTLVRVGPSTTASPAPSWSADLRTTGSVNCRATVNLSGQSALCGMWGAWFRIKQLPPQGGSLSVLQLFDQTTANLVADYSLDSNGNVTCKAFNFGSAQTVFTGPNVKLNTWIWLAVGWQIQSGANFPYGIRCLSLTPGGTLNTWGSANGLNALGTSFTSVNVGLQTGDTGPKLRIGCPSLYSMTSLSDIAYPSDITAPVEKSYNWYVNPSTGNDAKDGSTPATAWKTADKLTAESQYCGILDSNAAGPGGGDVLTIDTSAATLPLSSNMLTFATQGLLVQPLSGQTYIKFQAEKFLTNSAFTLASGTSHTYRTTDTQANIVTWENDKWMWHVKSASYGSTASVTDPHAGTTTNFATTAAALDATPGSFYTDGTNLYIHPFGNTTPASDGKTYTRSINRNSGAAVSFSAGNFRALGFYIRKTTMVDSADNCFGAYCLQDGVLDGNGFASSIEGAYLAYGDKHIFGSTTGVTNSTLLVLNTECEQGHPYCAYGGQSPFVSFTGADNSGTSHTYRNCTCLARSGLIGSTTGDTVGTGGDIILSHNNDGGISFTTLTLDNCNFASGTGTLTVAANLSIIDHTQLAGINTSCPNTTISGTTFGYQMVAMRAGSSQLSLYNCLLKPTFALSATNPVYYGLLLAGTATIEGCTFDLAGLSGNSATYFQGGIIERTGPLNLTFRNNAYIVPSGENFPLLHAATYGDTLMFDHNAYVLGGGTTLARSYTSATATSDYTYAQWQALGQDCTNSSLNAALNLTNDVPQSTSPLNNAGADLGVMADFTGTVYAHRNTIGAYQGSTAFKAPQSISTFPARQIYYIQPSQVSLPATTSAGLTITYIVVSGPATVSGHTLTFTGPGTIVLVATQAGNTSNAPITVTETITATRFVPDTPTMPQWALILLTALLAVTAVGTRGKTLAR